jgi:hypothetical protein
MDEEVTVPPPGLSERRVIHLDPVVDPPFVDARDWSQYVTPVETRRVDFEQLNPGITDAGAQQAKELALASDVTRRELEGKRYEVLWVGSRSLDRETERPLVITYNYTDDVVVETTVDLGAATVLDVSVERYQPPLAPAEQSQALDLVREDGRLLEAGIDIDTGMGLVIEEVNFRSPHFGHRLVDLRFAPANCRTPLAYAIADLTCGVVTRVGLLPREEQP